MMAQDSAFGFGRWDSHGLRMAGDGCLHERLVLALAKVMLVCLLAYLFVCLGSRWLAGSLRGKREIGERRDQNWLARSGWYYVCKTGPLCH